MLRHFFDVPGDHFASTPKARKNKHKGNAPAPSTGLEALEERKLLSATLDWALDLSSTGNNPYNYANVVAYDSQDNVVVAGSFTNEVDFDPSASEEKLTAVGGSDAYVASYASDGSLNMVVQLSASEGGYANISGLDVSDDGFIYVAGHTTNGLELTDLGGDADLAGDTGFLLKFNNDGELQWAQQLDVTFSNIAVTGVSDGTVIHAVGHFDTSVNFDTDESGDNILTDTGMGGFYATFDSQGNDIAALGLTGTGNETFNDLVVTDTAVYLLGSIGSFDGGANATLDSTVINAQPVTFQGPGNVNGLVVKLDNDGALVDTAQITSSDYAGLNDIALDSDGNLYIAGQYGGTLDLDPSGATNNITSTGQYTNAFFVSLDSNLAARWGRGLGTEGEATSIVVSTVNENEVVTIGGYFAGTVDFDPTAAVDNHTGEEGDGYIIVTNTDGDYAGVFTFGDAGYDGVSALAVNADSSKLALAGFVSSGDADVDPGVLVKNLANAVPGSALLLQLPSLLESDYSSAINTVTLPSAVVSGSITKGSVQVIIGNEASGSPSAGDRVDISVYARPVGATDDSDDVLIGTQSNKVLNIQQGKTRKYNVPVTLPENLDEQDYVFFAVVTPGEDEPITTDLSTAVITVADPFVNLTATINDSKFPDELTSGDGDKISSSITITNEGNVALANGAKINITLVARRADLNPGSINVLDNPDYVITTLENQNVSGLKAGASKTIHLNFTLPAGIDSDDYNIVAVIDSSDLIEESNENDNEAVSTATIDVTLGQVNLTATLDDSKLPNAAIAGDNTNVNVAVTIANEGNVALVKGAKVNIIFFARPADAIDDSDDVELAVLTNQSVSGLKPDATRKINTRVTLPTDLDTDDYVIVAIVDSANTIHESDEDDNEAVGDQSIAVAAAFVNLTATLDDSKFPEALTSGNGDMIKSSVTITNSGNVAVAKNTKISITLVARPDGANDDSDDVELTVLANQNISGLKADGTRKINVSFTLPAGLETDDYNIVAIVDSTNAVEESDEDDNEAVSDAQIAVTIGQVNLTATLDDSKFPEDVVAGNNAKINTSITITNDGNVALEKGAKINITLVARPVEGGDSVSSNTPQVSDFLITTLEDQNVSGLKAGASKTIHFNFTLPADLDTDEYQIVAIVDSSNQIEESDEDDNEAVSDATIAIVQGTVDLTVELDSSRIPSEAVSGSRTRFVIPATITNDGSLPLAQGQKVQITVVAKATNQQTVTLAVFDNVNLSNLKAGASKIVNLAFTLPLDANFVDGLDYTLQVNVDSGDDVDEIHEDNNSAVADTQVTITRGGTNLTGELDETNIPTDATSGDGSTFLLPITVTNEGPGALHRNQTIDIRVVARTSGNPESDVLVATLDDQNVSNLRVNGTKTFVASITLPGDLETSENVRLVVVIDSHDDVVESDEEDNTLISGVIDVTQGSRDLSVEITSDTATDITIGQAGNPDLTLNLTNEGTLATASDATATLRVYARPTDAIDNTDDVLIDTVENVDIGDLDAQDSQVVNIFDLNLSDLGVGSYNLVVVVDDSGALNADEENNEAVSDNTFEVQGLSQDLSVSITQESLPQEAFTEGSDVTANFSVVLTNDGNQAIGADTQVDLTIVARLVGAENDSEDIELSSTSFDVSNTAVDGTATYVVEDLDLSDLPAGEYVLVAIVDDLPLNNPVSNNNEASTEGTITVNALSQDLSLNLFDYSTSTMAQGESGETGNTLTLMLINNGNVAIPGDTTVDVLIYARPSEGEDILVDTISEDVSGLAPSDYKFVTANGLDLSELPADTYRLLATLDDSEFPGANSGNNTALSGGTFAVILI